MSVDVTGIPSSLLKPGFYGKYNTAGAASLGTFAQKLLVIGQRLAAGSVAALVPTQVFSAAEAATKFGAGSVIHRQVLSALAQNADLAPWVVALDDAASSAAATGSVTFTGTATANGTQVLYLGSSRVELAVLSGDTPSILAARLVSVVNARTELAVTASSSSGTVTLTAKNKGTVGNGLTLASGASVAGIASALVAFSGGATDPDLQPALDLVFPSQFHVVAVWDAGATAQAKVKTYLEAVSSAIEERPGRSYAAVTGTAKNIATQVTLASGLNHERLSVAYLPGSWSPAYEVGAALAAAVACETDPARPFDGVDLPGVMAPDISVRLSRSEQESLLAAGITPLEVNATGTVEIVRLVTTRTQTNGVPDLVLLDTTAIAVLDYLRSSVIAMFKAKFPRPKLTDAVLDSLSKNAFALALSLEDLEILQHVADYKALFVVERDPNVSGRVRMRIPAPWVPGLHQIFATFDLINL